MGVNLKKGEKVSLAKQQTNYDEFIVVGCGWDQANTGGWFGNRNNVDIDLSVICLGSNGKIVNPNNVNDSIVFYGNLQHPSGAIVHTGDNQTGEGQGYDEAIGIWLNRVPMYINSMVFILNIFDAYRKRQHFGMIKNAFASVFTSTKQLLCHYELTEDFRNSSLMNNKEGLIVGEIYRKDGEWKFNAIGQPVNQASTLEEIVRIFL